MFLLPILGYILLFFIDFKPLYKQKRWSDFWVNTFIGVVTFTMAMLLSFGVKIPSPEKPIRELITMLFGK
ncbi:MAG: hypothetical protein K0R71_1075 [Bacillales bacterium]|jgi:hypothetical protein|nr:hypothetical protein [Bacillales bacterium]